MNARSRPIRVSNDFYKHLKAKALINDSNLRVESKKVFTEYKELKEMAKKLRNKKIFVLKK